MRAKILFLPCTEMGESACGCAEQLLTEISAAFNHSFSLLRGRIGSDVADDEGCQVPDAVLDACQECQAVFLGDTEQDSVQELYDALELSLCIRSFSVPVSLRGEGGSETPLHVGAVLSLDRDTVQAAMESAFRFSQLQETRLYHIPPSGDARKDWDGAIQLQQVIRPQITAHALSAQDAVRSMILTPDRLGLMVCPPYAGSILSAAGSALTAEPAMIHEMACDGTLGVYGAPGSLCASGDGPDPLGPACAVAKLLRHSLGLHREACCLETAVANVLAAGWHTRRQDGAGIAPQGMVELICEQIAAAGELMRKNGDGPAE